jgi:hypothetical protein
MAYVIEHADLEKDGNDIVSVLGRSLPGISVERFNWMYQANPQGIARAWVARKDDGAVVGSGSAFPRRVRTLGQTLSAGITSDFAIDKECRAFGPALRLVKTVVAEYSRRGLDFFYTLPNEKSRELQKKLGCLRLGDMYRMVKPLKTDRYVKRFVKSEHISSFLSPVADFFLTVSSKESRTRLPRELEMVDVKGFDERFNRLWARVADQRPIMGERSSEVLNWRYVQTPIRKYDASAIVDNRSGDVLGYVVSYAEGNDVHIADMLAVDSTILRYLLTAFISGQRQKRRDSITVLYLGDPAVRSVIEGLGFSSRDRQNEILFHVDPSAPWSATVANQDNWYLFEGDLDI